MKKFLKWNLAIFILCFFIGLALLGYVYFIEPYQLIVKNIELKVPHWSDKLNGFKIVAASDFHGGGHTMTAERIKSIAGEINAQNPDIIVLLGDFVSQVQDDQPRTESPLKMPVVTIAESLKGLKAKYGVYVVIGNHDWWYDEKECRQEFEKVGFTVLENETESFEVNGETVTLLGIEDFWKREKVDVKGVLAKLPTQKNIIGLTHNPDSFDQTPDSLSILFAGHTHGGQVNFPIIGTPIVPAKKEYTSGHIIKYDKNLYVTSGIGTSGLPFRFRVPPEIVVVTLNSQQ